jgi:chemotaxis protein CheD
MIDTQPIYVSPGDVIVLQNQGLLVSTPLGSCVAVIAYDCITKTGGMAHVMLPGSCNICKTCDNKTMYRYAQEAIPNLIRKLYVRGVKKKNIKICLVGGANVLKKPKDTLVKNIVDSVLEVIYNAKIPVIETSLLGLKRRGASIEISSGIVHFSVGDAPSKILCIFKNSQ